MKSSKEIRKMWIDFFVKKNHLFVESKSLIPFHDPSLLWINSGVATLKDYFSGKKIPPSKRIVNSQKSIRTNDIENVGVTARHHTFFEMLGNFSIGDYFKEEAIEFAYEFIFDVLKFDKEKIYITFFEKDLKVKEKWMSLGICEDHLIAGSRELNFWDVGSGPCGSNTEIFYDRGEKFHPKGKELIEKDIENDRFIEIWNIVFSEFNNLGNNEYEELEQKNIDTGAGLERIVSIIQDGPTNFDTDLFLPIINEIEKYSPFQYKSDNYFIKNKEQEIINKHFKIIADHMRAITNAISDGEKPSNTKRGYIIRRLIRRCCYSGKKLNVKEEFFLYKLVQVVVDSLIFDVDVDKVSKIILDEEKAFSKTIKQGKNILDSLILKQDKNVPVDSKIIFKLHETYGFPIEMTIDILNENNLIVNLNEIETLKMNHSDISKTIESTISFNKAINSLTLVKSKVSEFVGYDYLEIEKAKILYMLNYNNEIDQSNEDDVVMLILDKTPFYATSGGQAHDEGYLIQNQNQIKLLDVFKDKFGNHIHVVKGKINKNEPISCFVNPFIRNGLMRNHSATHLTFAALRKIYGNQIEQLGSDNNQNRLTFDFHLDHKPTEEEIEQIELFVNNAINKKIKRNYIVTNLEEAKKLNAIMTKEDEEYLDHNNIRVVEFPTITADLCGGTHIDNTFNLQIYKIVSIETKGTNIYRIKAITSYESVDKYWQDQINKIKSILSSLYLKYVNLAKDKKQENNNIFSFSLPNLDLPLANQFKEYKKIEEKLANEIKKINKLNIVDEKINIKPNLLNFENYPLLIFNDIPKSQLKQFIATKREENEKEIVVGLSKNDDNSFLVVLGSKSYDLTKFINLLKNKVNLQGGGNKIFWQGKINSKILDIFKIK